MHLYTLLKDRASINVLKILSDNEENGKRYTMSHNEILGALPIPEGRETFANLLAAELVSSDRTEDGTVIFAITKKGKDFVAQFNRLIDVMAGKKEEKKAFDVQYNLTPMEQRILLLCSRIKSETGFVVPLKILAQEVYPYKDPGSKTSTVSKYAKKLEELKLLERVRNNNRVFFDVTESGERVIKEQFVEAQAVQGAK